MGADKALVEFRGRPLISHALDIVRAAGLPAFIAGARSSLESFATVVPDSGTGKGPLDGICAALDSLKLSSSAPQVQRAVFLPVDLPFLLPSLLSYMLHHVRITGLAVTLPSVNGFVQTFPVILSCDALPVLERELDRGHGGCLSAFRLVAAARGEPVSVLPVEVLVQSRKITHPAALPAAGWFFNVNTPADLNRASAIRAGHVS
jgi:molybdopterin-guanine dinucleotide biosynthesis protein A